MNAEPGAYVCVLCGSTEAPVVRAKGSLTVLRCKSCGRQQARQVETNISNDAVATDPGHFGMLIEREAELSMANAVLFDRRVARFNQVYGFHPTNWLEVGPGAGLFGDAVVRSGGSWLGVEIDGPMATRMQQAGRNVLHADFVHTDTGVFLGADSKGFDAVYSSQVLEHVPDPLRFLRNALQCLRPGGILHLDVPNGDGLTSWVRAHNPAAAGIGEIVPPHHLIAFTSQSLRMGLDRAGFSEVIVEPYGYDDPVFGVAHGLIKRRARLKMVWKAAALVGAGGNLVALARRPG